MVDTVVTIRIKNAYQMSEYSFPNAQLKLVEEIRNDELIEVEFKFP
jgi:hypothetical protein